MIGQFRCGARDFEGGGLLVGGSTVQVFEPCGRVDGAGREVVVGFNSFEVVGISRVEVARARDEFKHKVVALGLDYGRLT